MTGLIIEASGKVRRIKLDFKNFLQQCYKELDVRTIDIVSINIKGIRIDVIVDDEGLFKDKPKITVTSDMRSLVGNVLLLPGEVDAEGNYYSGFSNEQLAIIVEHIHTVIDFEHMELRSILEFEEGSL